MASVGSEGEELAEAWWQKSKVWSALLRIDAWSTLHQERLFYSIVSFWTLISALFTYIQGAIGGDEFARSSKLFTDVLTEQYWTRSNLLGGYSPKSFVLMVGTVYIVIGVQFVWVSSFEISAGTALSTPSKRIDLCGRFFAHVAFVLPAIGLLTSSKDPLIVAQNVIEIIFMQLYPVIAAICMVTCSASAERTPVWSRPIVGISVAFIMGASCLGTQFTMMQATKLNFCDFYQSFMIVVGLIALGAAFNYISDLVRGIPIPGRGYDIIVINVFATAWILSFRILRGTASITGIAETKDFENWLFFRFAGGFVFLAIWNLRSSHVFFRRVESEEKREAEIKARVLLSEQQTVMKLLHNIIPPRIVNQLSRGNEVNPEIHNFTTIFFSDICGFTKFASVKPPLEVFAMLRRLFLIMDHCVSLFSPFLYKIETIGDAFMVVGGLPHEDGVSTSDKDRREWEQQVVDATCQFALLVREAVQMVPLDEVSFVTIRMGIHAGPIVTGLSGSIVPRFSCFGDSINVASRMETTGSSNKIHISGVFGDLVRKLDWGAREYQLEAREPIEVKGKGRVQTYWLDVPDLADFRSKRSSALAHIDRMLHAFKGERYALTRDGTIKLESPMPLPRTTSFSIQMALSRTRMHQQQQQHTTSDLDALFLDIEMIDEDIYLPEPTRDAGKFQSLISTDFDILTMENSFDGICEAILVLFEGVVGSPGCKAVTDPETLARLVRRVGGRR